MSTTSDFFGKTVDSVKRGFNSIRSNMRRSTPPPVEPSTKRKLRAGSVAAGVIGTAGVIGAATGIAYTMSSMEDTNYNKPDEKDKKIRELEQL